MIRTLNSLRFILILMIVISHSTLPISQDLINYLGEFPVAIFFVIMLFYSVLNKNKSYFFFKYSTNLATALALWLMPFLISSPSSAKLWSYPSGTKIGS